MPDAYLPATDFGRHYIPAGYPYAGRATAESVITLLGEASIHRWILTRFLGAVGTLGLLVGIGIETWAALASPERVAAGAPMIIIGILFTAVFLHYVAKWRRNPFDFSGGDPAGHMLRSPVANLVIWLAVAPTAALVVAVVTKQAPIIAGALVASSLVLFGPPFLAPVIAARHASAIADSYLGGHPEVLQAVWSAAADGAPVPLVMARLTGVPVRCRR